MNTPVFCVSTKPGKAVCRTCCPPQGALFTTPRSGPGRTDLEGTLGPLPPPWRRHIPSRPCARSPAVEAAFLGLNLNNASISTTCSHQGEMEGPCLALHALPGRTQPRRGARPGLSQRSALICIRTCSAAAPPCIQPRPGSFPEGSPPHCAIMEPAPLHSSGPASRPWESLACLSRSLPLLRGLPFSSAPCYWGQGVDLPTALGSGFLFHRRLRNWGGEEWLWCSH